MHPTVERIQRLIQESGLTAKYVFTKLELSTNSLSEWKKGKAKPSLDAIIKLATFFNVTTDYLLIGKTSVANLRDDEIELLSLYNKLTPEFQYRYIGIIEGYVLGKAEEINMESIIDRRNA